MTREKLMERFPKLFIDIIKEGMEFMMYGITDISSIEDVNKGNEEIKRRIEHWDNINKDEEEYFTSLI